MSCLAPLDVPGVIAGMSRRNRLTLRLVGRPAVLRRVLKARMAVSVRRRPARVLARGVGAAVDKKYLGRPDDGGGATRLSRDVAQARADRRPVCALLTAEGVSQVGNSMTVIAGPWFVLQTTGSAAKTGLVGAALALGLLVPLLGGPLVDRLGFRRGSVVADLVSGATVASILALHLAGRLEYWQSVVLVFILASVNSQGDTARLALVPALARLAHMPFERVTARSSGWARCLARSSPAS
jgi:hypothetical protein